MKLLYMSIYCLLFMPGCRYVCWGEDVLYQATTGRTYNHITQCYVRSLRIYDQFTTLGLFDALWISPEVMRAYSTETAAQSGYTQERYEEILNNQYREYQDTIALYVLAALPHTHDAFLGSAESPWSLFLVVDDVPYTPISIKQIDAVPPVYQRFFGKKYAGFKTAYLVAFDAYDKNGEPIIAGTTNKLLVSFHMVGRADESMLWELTPEMRVRCCEVYNPDVLAYDLYAI